MALRDANRENSADLPEQAQVDELPFLFEGTGVDVVVNSTVTINPDFARRGIHLQDCAHAGTHR